MLRYIEYENLERLSARALLIGVLISPIVAVLGVFLFTVGTDEAWIQLLVRGLARGKGYGADSTAYVVHTTGGIFTVVTAFLQWLSGESIWFVRSAAVVTFLGFLFLIDRWAQLFGATSTTRYYATAAFLIVPGTFLLSSSIYGAIITSFLAILAIMAWGHMSQPLPRAIVTGLLMGAAIAVRMNTVFVFCVPVVSVLFESRKRKDEAISAVIAVVTGLVFYGIQKYILFAITATEDLPGVITDNTTQGVLPPIFQAPLYAISIITRNYTIGEKYFPTVLRVLITCLWIWQRPSVSYKKAIDGLLIFAWLLYLSWVAVTPIPHLRYLFPSSAAFGIAGGLVLVTIVERAESLKLLVTTVLVVLLLGSYVRVADEFMVGEYDLISWNWNGRSRRSELKSLRASQFERKTVNYIKTEIPEEDTIATIGFNTSLAFLTKRDIRPIEAHYTMLSENLWLNYKPEDKPAMPRWIVSTTFSDYFRGKKLSLEFDQWLRANCELVEDFQSHRIYRVTGAFPADPMVVLVPEDT